MQRLVIVNRAEIRQELDFTEQEWRTLLALLKRDYLQELVSLSPRDVEYPFQVTLPNLGFGLQERMCRGKYKIIGGNPTELHVELTEVYLG